MQSLPITLPGLRTELHPTSTLSPSIAPNFFRPVSIFCSLSFTTTNVLSDFTLDKTLVAVKNEGDEIETGLKKFGAMIGDYVEVGCNSVLNPGTVIGRNTNIYPLSPVRGVVPENSIYKSAENIVDKN